MKTKINAMLHQLCRLGGNLNAVVGRAIPWPPPMRLLKTARRGLTRPTILALALATALAARAPCHLW